MVGLRERHNLKHTTARCCCADGNGTHPAAPRVEVGGEGVEGVDVVHATGVLDVLAGNHPRLHGGQHGHEQLGELHPFLQTDANHEHAGPVHTPRHPPQVRAAPLAPALRQTLEHSAGVLPPHVSALPSRFTHSPPAARLHYQQALRGAKSRGRVRDSCPSDFAPKGSHSLSITVLCNCGGRRHIGLRRQHTYDGRAARPPRVCD